MQPPKLLIRKGMVSIQGRSRPCIQVLAVVDPAAKAKLEELFSTENLFKRTAYATGFPAGFPMPSAPLAPHLANFMKSDACPEITVKTILAGQLYQAQSIWEMKAFEFIACRAFDALVDFTTAVMELGRETTYTTQAARSYAEAATLAADAAAAAAALQPLAIPEVIVQTAA
jgi:hypothetical protein